MQANQLKPAKNSKKRKKRVGRGNASGHGTTATRGTKGQRARSGGRSGLKRLGFRFILARTPKLKGFKSLKIRPAVVSLDDIEKEFESGSRITADVLLKRKIARKGGFSVKIIAGKSKSLSKKFIVENCKVSERVRELIEKAGGTVSFK